LRLVHPLAWRAVVAAADVLIGDHGSATIYAAAVGVPVLQAGDAPESVKADSAGALLAEMAPKLSSSRPIGDQLRKTMSIFDPYAYLAIEERVSSRPRHAAQLLRSLMYRLLTLVEPSDQALTMPVNMSV